MTRRQELQKLPLQKRLQAMENIRRNESVFSFKQNLDSENCFVPLLFVYENTRQGHNYWWNVLRTYFPK